MWVVLTALGIWGLLFAASGPIRQAYLNDMIASKERATVLSFDSLMGNTGGVVFQPALGKAADVYTYPISFIASGVISLLAVPFLIASRRERSKADETGRGGH
jgi:MFS family permease